MSAASLDDTEALFPTVNPDEPFAPRVSDGPLVRPNGAVYASATGGRIEGFTAAAVNIPLMDGPDSPTMRRENAQQKKRPFNWQREAWRYYDDLSEVRAGGRWMGDAQSRIRLFPAVLSDDPDQPPTAASEAEGVSPGDLALAYDALDRLQSDEGDRNEIQRVFGLNLFIAGETWLVGTDEQPEFASRSNPTGERWRAFSVEELKVSDRGIWMVRPHENARDEECEQLDPETSRIVRIYRRHGRWRLWPDASMRAANLIAEELLLQTQSIMGALRSRLAAGILPIPDDIEVTPDDDDEEEGAADGQDPLLRKMIEHFSTPIGDQRSAAALVPFLMRLPADVIKSLPPNGVWEVARSIDPKQGERIDQLIHRLAIAFDMPPELLIGKGDINHWNAWEIDEDGVRLHVEPYTSLYAQALTASYLRPRLEMSGVADPERWVIWWDPTDVMSHPDQKQNALDGYNASPPLVSGHVTRRAIGFSDDDAPDDVELASIQEWRAKAPAAGTPFGGQPKQPPGEQHIAASIVAAAPPRARHIGPALVKIEERLHRDLLVAADGAVGRVIEKAQARIRSLAQKDKESRLLIAKVTNADLVGTLGPEQVRALGFDDASLADGFTGTVDQLQNFLDRSRAQAISALRAMGIEPTDAAIAEWEANTEHEDHEAGVILVGGLVALAAALLYGTGVGVPTTAPAVGEWDPSFQVPAGLVREVLSTAGGGPAPDGPDNNLGFLSGASFADVLNATPDLINTGFAWAVGAPLHPFDPHQALDGGYFADWNDEQLAADPGDFPYVSVYSPGDHDGCQCVVVPDAEIMDAIPVEVGE